MELGTHHKKEVPLVDGFVAVLGIGLLAIVAAAATVCAIAVVGCYVRLTQIEKTQREVQRRD